MTFKGMLNTLHTATGGTKRDWEEEKQQKAEQERQDMDRRYAQSSQVYDSGDQKEVRNPSVTGPAMGAEHNPDDAYKATQQNVKNAIQQVSRVPGATIAQQEIHKQAARDFARKNGINERAFMDLAPETQKDIMASNDPRAALKNVWSNHGPWFNQQ